MTDDEIRERIAQILFPMFPTYWDGNELRHKYPSGTSGPSHLYDRSVDAALTLCDRLRQEGWDVNLVLPRHSTYTDYFVELTRKKIVSPGLTIRDFSLARAICLAFLKVKGEVK